MPYSKENWPLEREYRVRYQRERAQRRVTEARNRLGGRCVVCDEVDVEFDHVDPESKSFEMGKQAGKVSDSRWEAEVAKCQLLCRPHHIEKHRQDAASGGNGWWEQVDSGSMADVVEVLRQHITLPT